MSFSIWNYFPSLETTLESVAEIAGEPCDTFCSSLKCVTSFPAYIAQKICAVFAACMDALYKCFPGDIGATKRENQEVKIRLSVLEPEHASLKIAHETLRTNHSDLQEACKKNFDLLHTIQQERDALQERNQELTHNLEQKTKECDRFNQDAKRFFEDARKLTLQVDQKNQELSQSHIKHGQLLRENEELKTERQTLKKQLDGAQQSLSGSKQLFGTLRATLKGQQQTPIYQQLETFWSQVPQEYLQPSAPPIEDPPPPYAPPVYAPSIQSDPPSK